MNVLSLLAFILFVAAALISRSRLADWTLCLIAAGLALWVISGITGDSINIGLG